MCDLIGIEKKSLRYEELRAGTKTGGKTKKAPSAVPDMQLDQARSDAQVKIGHAGLNVTSVGNWTGARTNWGVVQGN